MLSVRLDRDTEEQLNHLAKITQRPKSFFVKDALDGYLDEMLSFYQAEIPNQTTVKALNESKNKQGKSFDSLDDLLLDLEN